MKASEIFLEYAKLVSNAAPKNVSQEELQKILSVPEFVWNAVVLDKNPNRRKGDMPKIIKDQLQTIGTRHRTIFRKTLKYWVLRKDIEFAPCKWPLRIKVYKNVKGELIIRAEVLEPSDKTTYIPAEWLKEKPTANVVPLKGSSM